MQKERSQLYYYRKMMSYIGPYRRRRAFIVLLCTIEIIASTIIPYLFAKLVTMVQEGAVLTDILQYSIFLVLMGVIGSSLNTFQNYHWHIYNEQFTNYFRTLMLGAAFKKEMQFYRSNDEDFSSRILRDTAVMGSNISISFPMLFLNVIQISIVGLLMFWMSAKLALITFIVVPLYTLFFNKINQSMRETSNRERESYASLSGTVREYLDGIFQIKLYNKERYFEKKFQEDILNYEREVKQIKKYTAMSYGLGQLIQTILPIVLMVVGAYEVSQGRMSLGNLFAFYAYSGFLYEPMNNLSDWYVGLQMAIGMSERVFEFMDEREIVNVRQNKETQHIDRIEFKNVSFSYEDKNPVIENLSFVFQKGDIVGIVGSSGSGKSTLMDLILGIWDGYRGQIMIGDDELNTLERSSYHRKIAFVGQMPFLFSGSIKENVAFDGQDFVRVTESLALSKADEIMQEKGGLKSHILTGGGNLSGGEKQRINLARALYKEADLIILDEFTSALDHEIEKVVVSNLKEFAKEDKIVLIITHRKEPLSICNKIIDMDEPEKIQ
ncbi:MAG: ABC transporter ATP-binding protein [Peptostreptococcaceae bacterium]|nr:ABC transporter ATP-binding protein [Peptostreptococcaceae bacterium]